MFNSKKYGGRRASFFNNEKQNNNHISIIVDPFLENQLSKQKSPF